jgi:hypothetical protein
MRRVALFRSPSASTSGVLVTLLVLCAAILCAAIVWAPGLALADEAGDKAMCLGAFEETQSLREAGKLLAARQQALTCSQEACPDVVKTKCKTWQREIDEATPSIVVRVVDERGQDTTQATLTIDGAASAQRLDGLPISLDPGEHVVRVERPGQPPREERLVLALGERARRVTLSFAPDAPPPGTQKPGGTRIHPLTFIGFGLAGAGVIVGAVTGGLSMAKTADLEDACPEKRCGTVNQDLHDEALTLSHVSTISFAVAGAGAILGAVGLFALSDGVFGSETAVLIGPGFAGLSGRF